MNVIDKYAAYPKAIQKMEKEIDLLKASSLGLIILNKMNPESALSKMKGDYFLLKNLIRIKHGLEIKQVSTLRHIVNGELLVYKSKEMRKLVNQLMGEYIDELSNKE